MAKSIVIICVKYVLYKVFIIDKLIFIKRRYFKKYKELEMLMRVSIVLILVAVICSYVDGLENKTPLKIDPNDVTIVLHKEKTVEFSYA